jgi:hypothetical protein
MRIGMNLLLVVAALAITAIVYFASGGRAFVLFLPLLLGPLLFARRRA